MIAQTSRAVRLLPLAALFAAGGCFATRNDVRVVQSDLASFRTEQLKANADQREALAVAMRTLAVASDSVRVMSNRLTSVQGAMLGGLRDVNEQLIQVQVLLKQSASLIDRLRGEQEIRSTQAAAVPAILSAGMSDTSTRAAAPQTSASELLTNGRNQLTKGSWSTAREIFQELLTNYPTSDRAPDAQLYLAQAYDGAKNIAAALPAYAAVYQKYPDSPMAPRALWKRALIFESQGKIVEAKRELAIIVGRYKLSDEYSLADEKLKTMK